jgi:hypothetical protein
MGIILTCVCGKRLVTPDSAAGQRGRCSECRRLVFVPHETSRGTVYWSGTELQLLEACMHQAVSQLKIQDTDAVLDEAEKWAKAWKLPPEREPHKAGLSLAIDIIISCVQRDATVGMDSVAVLKAGDEDMIRVAVDRQGTEFLHIVARVGEDEYLCWHHRDAEDEMADNEKQRTDILQSLSSGVHCELCNYNMGYVRLLKNPGLAPIVGYRCSECNKLFCSKCHGRHKEGCPSCKAGFENLQYLARRTQAPM